LEVASSVLTSALLAIEKTNAKMKEAGQNEVHFDPLVEKEETTPIHIR
jgi:hypothetical protein